MISHSLPSTGTPTGNCERVSRPRRSSSALCEQSQGCPLPMLCIQPSHHAESLVGATDHLPMISIILQLSQCKAWRSTIIYHQLYSRQQQPQSQKLIRGS